LRQILDRIKRFFFRAEQYVTCQERSVGGGAARFDFKNDQSESPTSSGNLRNLDRMDSQTEPGIGKTGRKKILHCVTRNRECESARDHRVDPDNSTSGVREWTTRITWCEPEIGLYPRVRAETTERPDAVNRSGRERSDKTKRFPMAMASSPGRTCDESAAIAAGRLFALTRSTAMSR
jgi:hypothetical protein